MSVYNLTNGSHGLFISSQTLRLKINNQRLRFPVKNSSDVLE